MRPDAGGPVGDFPALRAVINPDYDTIEVIDGTGLLLSLTFDEAEALCEQIRALLVTWRR